MLFNFYFDSFSWRIMCFGGKLFYSCSILVLKKKKEKINKTGKRKQLVVSIKVTKKKTHSYYQWVPLDNKGFIEVFFIYRFKNSSGWEIKITSI
jgi:hypothetical protein